MLNLNGNINFEFVMIRDPFLKLCTNKKKTMKHPKNPAGIRRNISTGRVGEREREEDHTDREPCRVQN